MKLTLPRNDRLSCSVSKPGVDGTYHPCQVSFSDGTAMIQKGGANHTFRISNDSYARRYSRTKFLATSKTSSPLPHNLWNRQSQKVSCRYTLTSIHLDIYILPRGSCLLVVRPGCMRGSRSLRTLEGGRCHGFPMTLTERRWCVDLNVPSLPTGVLLRHPIGRLNRDRSSESDA